MFARRARAKAHEERDQSYWIDRNKDRNKSEEKFLDHTGMAVVFTLPRKPFTQCSLPSSIKPFRMKNLQLSILLCAVAADLWAGELKSVDDFRAAAAKTNAMLTIPHWEQTPEAVEASMRDAIAKANSALDQIGAQDLGKVTFKSTVVALDDLTYKAGIAANKATIIKETNTNPAMRTAGENAVKIFQEWAVGIDYREDVYKAITVEENAKSEATRKQLYLVRETLAKDTNVSVLNQLLSLRNKIALRLGYKSWDDYQIEVKMAKTGTNAEKYINDLIVGIQPKFDSEVAELQKLKAADTSDPNAKIEVWDWRYYSNQRNKQKYDVDKEALRAYFPFQRVLDGMFNIYQSIFGLKFEKIAVPYKWIDDLQLYMVTDSSTGEPLGMFYLDMFPREGKFNHFAQFDIISGKLLPDGKYQRPTVALLCNFPPATADKPSLLTHTDVETLFHEFGHALHSIVTRAKYGRFAGTHVPGDFVEAPSQMLQNWVWDKKVLDTFAADYRDPSKKIPAETIKKMNDAKLANAGAFYRRQFAFASLDLALHNQHPENDTYDCVAISNPILEKVFLPIDPSTTFVSYFGHLNGYDAGYYGYAWADAIAADMATVFAKARDGYLYKQAGMKLRREIYEPGDLRDANVCIA